MDKNTGLLFAGLGGLAIGRSLLKKEIGKPLISTHLVAGRAFGIASIFCVSTFSACVGCVGLALNVKTLKEFADKMKVWAPQKRRRIQQFLGIQEKEWTEEDERIAMEQLKSLFKE